MEEGSKLDKKSLKLVKTKNPDWDELAKDCVAFANAKGGDIYIGIEDDAESPDPKQKIEQSLVEKIRRIIPQKTSGVALNVDKLTFDNGGEAIKISILHSSQLIASTTSGKYYVRIADESKPIMPEDLTRMASEKQAFIWEEKVVRKVSSNETDFVKLRKFIDDIKSSDRVSGFVKEKSDEEILEYYSLSENDMLTNLGILWIGNRKDRARLKYAPSVQFIKYDNAGNKINKIVWDDYSLNPKELIQEIISLSDWKESIEISDGLFRKNIPNYDIEVIRELIANALVHRVYTMMGDIFINLHHDRLEIHSPGLLPMGVTPSNIISKSIYRNQFLAKVFFDLKLMEKEGSGYDKVYELLLFSGKPIPTVEEWDDRVVVTVNKNIVSKEVSRLMSRMKDEYSLSQKEIIALGIITQNSSISSIELSKKLGLRNKENSGLKYWINKLIDYGIVLSKGKTKAREYFINPKVLKQLDFKGKTDLKKIESHRLEELILEDLKIYQPCSITQIHERIGKEISRKKVKRHLDKLIEDNKIKAEGVNRWRKYMLKSKS